MLTKTREGMCVSVNLERSNEARVTTILIEVQWLLVRFGNYVLLSAPKRLSSYLILARFRPAHHCQSSCKYDAKNRKHQLLHNTPEVAVSNVFLMMTLILENS